MKANAERIIQNNMKPLYLTYKKPSCLQRSAGKLTWRLRPYLRGGAIKRGDASSRQAVMRRYSSDENKDFIKGMHIWSWTANRKVTGSHG